MKILFILPEYYPHSGAGISTYYIEYIKALRPRCERIKVLVGSGYTAPGNKFNMDGVEVEGLKPELFQSAIKKFTRFNVDPEFRNNLAAAWAMYEQTDKGEGFDIIECTDFGFGFVPWVINHAKPVVTRLHGSAGQITMHEHGENANSFSECFIKQAELLLLPLSDGLVTHSTANQTFWNNLLNNEQVIKIAPVYGNNNNQASTLSERDANGLVTSRIQRWKGPYELCKAMSLIDEQSRPAIKWFGRDMPFTKNKTTRQYLSETFPSVWGKSLIPQNKVSNDEIVQLQRKAKFGLVASTWDVYNFTCLEFLASGTPVICSDGAGVSDLIEHGKNGFKYPANNLVALSECLKLLNSINESEYNKISAAAVESLKDLSAEKVIPINIELYQSVLSNFKPGSLNQYLSAIYSPQNIEHPIDDLLDQQPLKKISSYFFKRILKKVTAKK